MALIGDMKQMKPRYVKAAIVLRYGATLLLEVGVPIPILDEEIEGRETLTVPLSSLPMAREIAQTLKTWISPGKFDIRCGEIISAVVLANHIHRCTEGLMVVTRWQAGIVTDTNHGDANILEVKPNKIKELLELGNIVIVAGFQGATSDGTITTLGRGGSDIKAAALGVALAAERVEVYTDVNGVATCDPKVIPDAPVLTWLEYKTALELLNQGAKVLHTRAVEILYGKGITLIVKNIKGNHPGTRIVPNSPNNPNNILLV